MWFICCSSSPFNTGSPTLCHTPQKRKTRHTPHTPTHPATPPSFPPPHTHPAVFLLFYTFAFWTFLLIHCAHYLPRFAITDSHLFYTSLHSVHPVQFTLPCLTGLSFTLMAYHSPPFPPSGTARPRMPATPHAPHTRHHALPPFRPALHLPHHHLTLPPLHHPHPWAWVGVWRALPLVF